MSDTRPPAGGDPAPDPIAQLRAAIDQVVQQAAGEAYEIGHAHGGNPYRAGRGEPAQRVNDGWGTPAATAVEQVMQLIQGLVTDALQRSDHFEMLFAAVVAKSGPVMLTGTEFAAARPDEMIQFSLPVEDPAGQDAPIMWALPEQLATPAGDEPTDPAAGQS